MTEKSGKFSTWLNERFPLREIWNQHVGEYYAPKNLNFWYFFGVFSLVVLVNQILTGIWLTMYYIPTNAEAFNSVEHIMRNVKYGWLIRYMHSTGASAFFIVVLLHMYRAIIYGSYQKPRELVWIIGMLLYVLLITEAFTGYVLPWGQMSFWAGKVIISVFNTIPWIGKHISIWIQGDYNLSGITLHRLFSFHVTIFPMLIVLLIFMHIMALHKVGSNNPEGVDIKRHLDKKGNPKDGITFHPYYTVHDLFGVLIFLLFFAIVLFYFPTFGGYFLEPENFTPANPLITPEHITPVWYFAPYYAMLRAIPNKLFGTGVMAASIAIMFVMPWLDRSKVKSIRYKGIYSKIAIIGLVISFCFLGFLGTRPPTTGYVWLSRLFTLIYFAFFLLMPIYTKLEETKKVPDRIIR